MNLKTLDKWLLWMDLFAWIGGSAYIMNAHGFNTGMGVFMLAYFVRGRREH